MNSEEKIHLKTDLLYECLRIQQGLVDTAKNAMKNAQDTANDEKSTMEDKFESFREQMQIERDMYAKLFDEAMTHFENLKKINVSRIQDAAAAGTVVVTPEQTYFIAGSLGKVVLGNQTYMVISPLSPIFRAFAGKKKKEQYEFREKKLEIIDVY